ncbi:MAG: J domain-containing protein [Bacteroidota bacterium]
MPKKVPGAGAFLLMKWFKNIKDLQELRKLYRKLAVQYHPDKGGDTAAMQEINNEYDTLSRVLINSNANFSEERKVYETEASEELREMIANVIFLPNITIEIIGSWLWITGETKAIKEQLKEHGFRFSPKKTAWYWHHGEYRKIGKKQFDMDDIRQMWGSATVEKEEPSEITNNAYTF